MRKLFALVAFMVWTLQASATDGISVANVPIPQSGEAIIEVNLESVTRKYGGFQFDLQLPAGISATTIVKAARLKAIEGYVLQMNLSNADDNIYTVLGYNSSHTEIAENNGTVAYIALRAGSGPVSGNNLTAYIQNVVVSTVTPENFDGANSSFGITVTNELSTVTFDETSSDPIQVSSVAVNVTVNRTINANEWSTICLPFAMSEAQVKTAFGDDVQLAEFYDWSFSGTSDDVTAINIVFSAVNQIAAHTPYIIKISEGLTSFSAYNVESITNNNNKAPKKNRFFEYDEVPMTGSFIGNYVPGTITNSNRLFLANNKFYYSSGTTAINGFRAVFDFGSIVLNDKTISNSNASRITMSIDDSETTAIKDAKKETKTDNRYYNLSGQQVKDPKKGVYVKDGKKVIIK